MPRSQSPRRVGRREWLAGFGAAALGLRGGAALAALDGPRRLAFHHLHTGEDLDLVYRDGGGYRTDALVRINRVLRDHRTGDVAPIDPALLDLLHRLRRRMDSDAPFEVICGFRSAKTNEMLRAKSSGVAKHSLHLAGMAIDVRLPGRRLADLRDAAWGLQAGGVGFYAKSDFIHVDTGRVRRW